MEDPNLYYMEIDGCPVPCDHETYMNWRVARDEQGEHCLRVKLDYVGDIRVSTVFLGIDHNFDPDGPPILYETMIFAPYGGPHDQAQWRHHTREEASLHHDVLVAALKKEQGIV